MAKEGSKRVVIVGLDDKRQLYLDVLWKESFCHRVEKPLDACHQQGFLTRGISHSLTITGQMKKNKKKKKTQKAIFRIF